MVKEPNYGFLLFFIGLDMVTSVLGSNPNFGSPYCVWRCKKFIEFNFILRLFKENIGFWTKGLDSEFRLSVATGFYMKRDQNSELPY